MSLFKEISSFEETEEQRKIHEKMYFPTSINFLRCHYGIRPNCTHGMIGTMGSGKTSLFKKIISESAEGKRVLVWLSEESEKEYSPGLYQYNKNENILKNIVFIEEGKITHEAAPNHDSFLRLFRQLYVQSGCDIVFIDNITTSRFYSQETGITNQSKTATFFRHMTKDENINATIFYLAHTSKNIKDNSPYLTEPEDIKGNAEVAIRSEYFYTIQKFTSGDVQTNFVRNCKHRHHPDAKGTFIQFFDMGKYTCDEKVPFEKINEIFKKRDRLGK